MEKPQVVDVLMPKRILSMDMQQGKKESQEHITLGRQ